MPSFKLSFLPALLLHEKFQMPYCQACLQVAKRKGIKAYALHRELRDSSRKARRALPAYAAEPNSFLGLKVNPCMECSRKALSKYEVDEGCFTTKLTSYLHSNKGACRSCTKTWLCALCFTHSCKKMEENLGSRYTSENGTQSMTIQRL